MKIAFLKMKYDLFLEYFKLKTDKSLDPIQKETMRQQILSNLYFLDQSFTCNIKGLFTYCFYIGYSNIVLNYKVEKLKNNSYEIRLQN